MTLEINILVWHRLTNVVELSLLMRSQPSFDNLLIFMSYRDRNLQSDHKCLTECCIALYITNLVCYTYMHWFFNPECRHIFGKQTGYIFQSPTTIKTWTTKHYLHWINGIIRNNKCIFYKLNAVFYTQNGCMNKKILQRLIPSQIPDRFSKLLCSTAVP
jgi:hypothetical protein